MITLNLAQAKAIVDLFGGEDATIGLAYGDGHSGRGLYAHFVDAPDEGSAFIAREHDAAAIRRAWWLSHGCAFPVLYGDDGEMQCAAHDGIRGVDFKRDPVERLQQHTVEVRAAIRRAADESAKAEYMHGWRAGMEDAAKACDLYAEMRYGNQSAYDAIKACVAKIRALAAPGDECAPAQPEVRCETSTSGFVMTAREAFAVSAAVCEWEADHGAGHIPVCTQRALRDAARQIRGFGEGNTTPCEHKFAEQVRCVRCGWIYDGTPDEPAPATAPEPVQPERGADCPEHPAQPEPAPKPPSILARPMTLRTDFFGGVYALPQPKPAVAEIEQLRTDASAIRRVLGMADTWPLADILAVLCDATDHLLVTHGCDGHGHEEYRLGVTKGREYVVRLRALAAPGREIVTVDDVLAWMRERPGASWQSTITDVEYAVRRIQESRTPAPGSGGAE